MTSRDLRRVLLVEDDPDIQAVADVALSWIGGLEVEVCGSARDALDKARVFRPDLILLDVMMPGMDGPQALAALREIPETRATPVVFMTARVQPHEMRPLQGARIAGRDREALRAAGAGRPAPSDVGSFRDPGRPMTSRLTPRPRRAARGAPPRLRGGPAPEGPGNRGGDGGAPAARPRAGSPRGGLPPRPPPLRLLRHLRVRGRAPRRRRAQTRLSPGDGSGGDGRVGRRARPPPGGAASGRPRRAAGGGRG